MSDSYLLMINPVKEYKKTPLLTEYEATCSRIPYFRMTGYCFESLKSEAIVRIQHLINSIKNE